MKKYYPKNKKKKNLVNRNRRLVRDMKTLDGIIYHFQTQMPKKQANG